MINKKQILALFAIVCVLITTEVKGQIKLAAGEISAGNGFENIIPIHWSKHAGGSVSEFHLYRKSNNEEYIAIDTLSSSRIHTIDDDVVPGVVYTYKIGALIGETEVSGINESEAACSATGHQITVPGFSTTTPILDGVMSDGEWDDAELIDITNSTSIWTDPLDKQTFASIKYVDGKLYIAVRDFNDTTKDQNDQIHIFFDFNNDNIWSEEDGDGRFLVVWNDTAHLDWSTYTVMNGVYPNPVFGDGYWMYEEDFMAAALEVAADGESVIYEAMIDLNSSVLGFDSDENNFGLMIQCSRYTADGTSGVVGMFPNNCLWGSPATFAEANVMLSEDNEAPQVANLSGNEAIINQEMNLKLEVTDISAIASIVGEYTIDGTTQQITLTSRKDRFAEKSSDKNVYIYSGMIPAQSANTVGTIHFICEDEYGNAETSIDYPISWAGDDTAPEISYLLAPTEQHSGQLVSVKASITDESGIASVTLKYTVTGENEVSIVMENISEDIYSAEIPGQVEGTSVVYKIAATDDSPSANEITSDEITVLWHEYVSEWFGNYDGMKTGGLGYSQDTPWGAGMVLELGDVAGVIDKISYMCNNGTNSPLNWKVYEMISGEEWSTNLIEDGGLLTDDLVVGSDEWTDVAVSSSVELSGTVGLYIELPNGGYIARDENSTYNISWFHNFDPSVPTTEWRKLGEGALEDYPGDWLIRCHIYGSNGVESEVIAGVSELLGNYPNPFNPETVIRYRNNISGKVTISVYNAMGAIVKEFGFENQSAGNHTVKFNGLSLNSGVYYYSLNVNGKMINTKKMVLIK